MTWKVECVAAAFLAFLALPAFAHDAPKGWTYDTTCCHNRDCRPISSSRVKERPEGYLITIDNEVIPYHDARIKDSPDGLFHWCTVNGRDDSRTICLYVPPRGF